MNKGLMWQLLPVLLAVGLLWYVLRDVSLTDLSAQFNQASYWWLALVGLIVVAYHLVRAARWQLTLQALGYQPSLFRTTVALLSGGLASMIIPGAGELTRCGTLQRTDGIPLAQSVGSVVVERVVDLLLLVALIALTFLLEFNRVGRYLTDLLSTGYAANAQSRSILIGLFLVGLVLLGSLYWLLQMQAFRQHRFIIRLTGIFHDIVKGFMSIRQLKRPGLFISLTVLSYILAFLTTYTLFFASAKTHTLPPTAALTILTVSSLGGLAVPTQGGIGTYHFLVSRALVLYGFTSAEGAVVATFLHAVGFGINLLLSSVSFLVLPMLITTRPTKQPDSLRK